MSGEGTGETSYEVSIEGEIHPWGSDTISVAEIRELGDIPEDARVAAVGLADGEEHVLDEDAVHDVPPLEPGKPVVKRTDFRRAS